MSAPQCLPGENGLIPISFAIIATFAQDLIVEPGPPNPGRAPPIEARTKSDSHPRGRWPSRPMT